MSTYRATLLGLCLGLLPGCGDDSSTSTETSDTGDTSATGPTSTSPTSTGDTTSDGSDTGSGSATSGPTTTADTGATGTETSGTDTETGTSGDESGTSGDSSSTGGSSTGGAVCTPILFTDVNESAFTGDDLCAGVQQNAVLEDSTETTAHHDAWCTSVHECQDPDPPCGEPPNLPAEGEMIVYVFGSSTGCSGFAQINDVLDCGDTIEVHYTYGGIGACDAVVNGWASASIPASADEVVFVDDT